MSVACRTEVSRGGCQIGGPPWQRRLKTVPSAGVWNFLGFRLDCGPASDPFFRRAVATGLHSASLAGGLTPAGGIFHPDLYEHDPAAWCGADSGMASAFLRRGGYFGTPVRMIYTMTNPVRRKIATAAARQLETLGLHVQVEGVPVDELERRVRSGQAELFIAGMMMPADPAEAARLFSSDGPGNLFGFSDARIEKQIARLKNRRASWGDLAIVEQILRTEAVLVPISFSTWDRRSATPRLEALKQWAV